MKQIGTYGEVAQKLIARLRKELNLKIPEGTRLRRTYAGHWQKSAGAWSWYLYHDNIAHMSSIGSSYSASRLVKSSNLSIYKARSWDSEIEILPE